MQMKYFQQLIMQNNYNNRFLKILLSFCENK